MSKKSDKWMPMYIGDYLRDTSRLTRDQHGGYLLLIFDYWINGPIPDEDRALAAIAKASAEEWAILRPVLSRFFRISRGLWRHKRIDIERSTASDITGKRRNAGKTGAAARWQNDGKRMRLPSLSGWPGHTPSPSPSPPLRGSLLQEEVRGRGTSKTQGNVIPLPVNLDDPNFPDDEVAEG